MPIGTIMGAASFGLNLLGSNPFGMFGPTAADQENERRRMANRAAQLQRSQMNETIRLRNQLKADRYKVNLQMYDAQRAFNADAAQHAFSNIQSNAVEQKRSLDFARQRGRQQHLAALGANIAAGEGRGRSFELANLKNVSGRFYQNMAELAMTERGIDMKVIDDLASTARQWYGADLQAWSNVAMPPYMEQSLPPAMNMPMVSQSSAGEWLKIGQAGLGAYQAFKQFSPPTNPLSGGINTPTNMGSMGNIGSSGFKLDMKLGSLIK
jgi:hypothetical protein